MKVHLDYKYICCVLGRNDEFPSGVGCEPEMCGSKEDVICDEEYTPFTCKYQTYETSTVLLDVERVFINPDYVCVGKIKIPWTRVIYLSVDGKPFIDFIETDK
jgi:hypothetical protein